MFEQFKNNPEYRNKVIRVALFFLLFVIVVIAGVYSFSSSNENKNSAELVNNIEGEHIKGDTVSNIVEKGIIYKEGDRGNVVDIINDGNATGTTAEGYSVQTTNDGASVYPSNEKVDNSDIDRYLKERRSSINQMQSSSPRKYNPNGSSSDWTTTSTTSSHRTIPQSSPRSPYNTNNNDDDTNDLVVNTQSSKSIIETPNQEKPLSKKERFEKSKNTSSTNKKNSSSDLIAQIRGDQKLASGEIIRLITSSETKLNNVTIPRGTPIYGTIRFSQDRANITLSSLKVNNKIVNLSLEGYANDGLKGIPINTSQLLVNGQRVADSEVNSALSKTGKVGNVVAGILSKSSRNNKIEINFLDNQKIYFK